MEDESLREAFSDWEELSMTQEQRLAYQSRLKHILDEEARQRRWELREQEEKERIERIAELEERVEKGKKEIEEGKKRIDQDKKEIVEREKKANLNAKKEIARRDRKSTRLNSSHVAISYAVFCLKKKKT